MSTKMTPRRSPRIAARSSPSTSESSKQQSRLDGTRKKAPGRRPLLLTKRTRTSAKAAAKSGDGTPSKKTKLEHSTSVVSKKEPISSPHQSEAMKSEPTEKCWEQLPTMLLVNIVPWTDSRSVESARSVCRTWRHKIDSFIVVRESFTGDVLDTNVWKTDKLNTNVFQVERPMRGYLRRDAKKLSKFNQWSRLTTRQLLPSGTIISYLIRFPASWGNETKFTATGGAILKRHNLTYTPTQLRPQDDSSFTWQSWDGCFHGIAYSAVRPGERWYSIAQEVVSDGVITYEDGRRLFKLPCIVPREGIEGALLLQHLDVGSAVCMDIANLFIVKL